MISFERNDKSEFIDFDKIEKSVKCMIYYIGFKYQSYICNTRHDFSMSAEVLSDFFILTVKNIDYRVYIVGVDKKRLCIFQISLF